MRIRLACGIWVLLSGQSPTYLYRLGSSEVFPLEVLSWRLSDTTIQQVIRVPTYAFREIFFDDSLKVELIFSCEGMPPQIYHTVSAQSETLHFTCSWKVLPGQRGWSLLFRAEGSSAEGFAIGHLPPAPYPWTVWGMKVFAWQKDTFREVPLDSFSLLLRPYLYDTSYPTAPHVWRRKSKTKSPLSNVGAWYLPGLYVWQKDRPLYPPYKYLQKQGALSDSLQELWLSRVKYAATTFSRTKPGERSDRGLIWIFMGPPSAILYAYHRQIWIYENLFGQTVFWEFSFEAEEWKLLRRSEYQPIWQKALEAWSM